MSYTPPAGNAVYFDLGGAYTLPAGNAVIFDFNPPPPPLLQILNFYLPLMNILLAW